jgi:uncharacterized protein YbaR (Trm112 family)
MKESSLDILCCPVCKGPLQLKNAEKKGNEVIRGTLVCTKCGKKYPIKDGIVDLVL